jgi:tetratricopeptide (TPR) repeat protein
MLLQGQIEPAGQLIEQILKRNPQSGRALCAKGALNGFKNKWDDAKSMFTYALEINPKNDTALTGIGLYHLQKGDKNSAWEYFEHATNINPENTRALLGLIEVGYSTQRLDGVERALKAYLDMHPADMDFLYSLAGCLFAQNRLSEAKAEVDKITLFKPDHRDALELRGMIEAKAGNPAPQSVGFSR